MRSSKSAANQPRIDYAALTATVSLLFACAARPASAGFDWGSGCAGGNGSFAVNFQDSGQDQEPGSDSSEVSDVGTGK